MVVTQISCRPNDSAHKPQHTWCAVCTVKKWFRTRDFYNRDVHASGHAVCSAVFVLYEAYRIRAAKQLMRSDYRVRTVCCCCWCVLSVYHSGHLIIRLHCRLYSCLTVVDRHVAGLSGVYAFTCLPNARCFPGSRPFVTCSPSESTSWFRGHGESPWYNMPAAGEWRLLITKKLFSCTRTRLARQLDAACSWTRGCARLARRHRCYGIRERPDPRPPRCISEAVPDPEGQAAGAELDGQA